MSSSASLATLPPPARTVSRTRRARAVLAAEWIKLRSLRSLPVTLVVAAVFCVGLAALVCSDYAGHWKDVSAADRNTFDPLTVNFGFLRIGVLFFGVLGALVVTSEYGNGLIRTTFAATPQRGLVLAAKAALLGALALPASSVVCFAAFFVGQGLLSGHVPTVHIGDPGVLGHLLGAVAYLTATGLCGVFLGVLARGTAVAMTSVFALFLMLPVTVDELPHTALWRYTVPYLPSNLGETVWHSHTTGLLTAGPAWALLVLWPAGLGTLAALWLRHHDA
ncbi:ABC transporter permease [Catenulispora sp. NL8]|uniref:ABC transporter permease n=1 Tax=Catenulispora pinistramenti TaxID=2705254 RepID=A0ABS5KHP0_9ACTN|nr:ABC transporter permease [Catenulispora pinistramenti]MBS2545881.1 ABC transporter permease [Catenulispora pinistramenti]